MRIGTGFCFTLCLATGLGAQIRGVGSVVYPAGGPGTPGVTRTVGSVVNPAGGVPHAVVPGTRRPAGPASRNRGGYAYPVYIGGYYAAPYISSYDEYDSSAYAPAQQPPAQTNVTVVMPPQQPVTPVVINYNYPPTAPPANADVAGDQTQDASAAEPSHYLIAFKDHTIYAATAYWVEGDTLHYFTAGNVHNQASLSLVDREFTARLNKEAGVEVNLQAPAK
jgi:hypothetical protein